MSNSNHINKVTLIMLILVFSLANILILIDIINQRNDVQIIDLYHNSTLITQCITITEGGGVLLMSCELIITMLVILLFVTIGHRDVLMIERYWVLLNMALLIAYLTIGGLYSRWNESMKLLNFLLFYLMCKKGVIINLFANFYNNLIGKLIMVMSCITFTDLYIYYIILKEACVRKTTLIEGLIGVPLYACLFRNMVLTLSFIYICLKDKILSGHPT